MKLLEKVLKTSLIVLVISMVITCLWQVFTRFILVSPSKYTEEFLRYNLIWLTMLGIPYVHKSSKHIFLDIIVGKMDKKSNLRRMIVLESIITVLSITVFIIGGFMIVYNTRDQISAAMKIPMSFYYLPVLISGIMMVIVSVNKIHKLIKSMKGVK